MVGATAFFLAVVLPPRLDDGLEQCAGINVTVLADTEKKYAIEDALDGFVEFVFDKKVVAVVLFEKVLGEFTAGLFKELKEVGVERPRPVRLMSHC